MERVVVQFLNPEDGQYVLIAIDNGEILERSTEPFEDVPILNRRERRKFGL